MKPEEYLERTRAPKPAPFLRQNVLSEAERAWRAPRRRAGIREIAFHPLAAAASVVFALGFALLSSEIDGRATASLVGYIHPKEPVEERRRFAGQRENFQSHGWLWDDRTADALVWNGIGAGFNRRQAEDAEPPRDRGT